MDKKDEVVNNELQEMSTEEFIEKLKADANAELYGNVDDEDDTNEITEEVKEQQKQQVLDDFSKFTRLIRRLKKAKAEMKELAMFNKDNAELQKYIKLIDKVTELDKEIDEAKKGYLYESAILSPETTLENKDVKVTVTVPYEKEDFDVKQFKEDYAPETEEYKKYVITKTVKGNIKFKIKEK